MSKNPLSSPSMQVMARVAFGCAPVLVAALFAATPAAAQNVGSSFQRNKNTAVRSRARPDYDALGIRSGAFLIYPKVTVDGTYDSNVYGNDLNKRSDEIATVSGQVLAASGWSRHSLSAFARAARAEYSKNNSESNSTWAVGTSGQLDVQRDFALSASTEFDHSVESRTASGTPFSAKKPIQYDLAALDLGGAKAFNRLRVKTAFSYRDYNYKDYVNNSGFTVNQDYRDQANYKGALQVDYAVSPDTALFVRGEREWRRFDKPPPIGGVNRDSAGYTLNAGADFELTSLVRGQIQGGYLNYNFDDPRTGDVKSFSANASVEYFPTQLLTLTFNGSRAVGDTGLFSTAGYLTTNVSAQADYELLRNLILTGRLGYGKDSYRGVDRHDKRWNGTLGATYLLNRSLGLNVNYSHQNQDSAGLQPGPSYGIDRVSVALTLQR